MKGIAGRYRVAAVCVLAGVSMLAHGAQAGASADELLGDAQRVLQQTLRIVSIRWHDDSQAGNLRVERVVAA